MTQHTPMLPHPPCSLRKQTRIDWHHQCFFQAVRHTYPRARTQVQRLPSFASCIHSWFSRNSRHHKEMRPAMVGVKATMQWITFTLLPRINSRWLRSLAQHCDLAIHPCKIDPDVHAVDAGTTALCVGPNGKLMCIKSACVRSTW